MFRPKTDRLDHLQTARNALNQDGGNDLLEYMNQVAQAHALVSIAESLKVIADDIKARS